MPEVFQTKGLVKRPQKSLDQVRGLCGCKLLIPRCKSHCRPDEHLSGEILWGSPLCGVDGTLKKPSDQVLLL